MRIVLVLLLCIGLVGCATGYARRGWTGGYSDMKMQEDIFRVAFSGNAYVGMGRVEDYTLLRSAEVALENGYKYFIIIDEKSATSTGSYTTPVTAQTSGTGSAYGGSGYAHGSYSGTTTYSGGQTYTFSKPSARNTIKCFKEKPELPTMVYDAEQVARNLKNAYNIKDRKKN